MSSAICNEIHGQGVVHHTAVRFDALIIDKSDPLSY